MERVVSKSGNRRQICKTKTIGYYCDEIHSSSKLDNSGWLKIMQVTVKNEKMMLVFKWAISWEIKRRKLGGEDRTYIWKTIAATKDKWKCNNFQEKVFFENEKSIMVKKYDQNKNWSGFRNLRINKINIINKR